MGSYKISYDKNYFLVSLVNYAIGFGRYDQSHVIRIIPDSANHVYIGRDFNSIGHIIPFDTKILIFCIYGYRSNMKCI